MDHLTITFLEFSFILSTNYVCLNLHHSFQESIEEEVKDITEAFASARASASFVDADLIDDDEEEGSGENDPDDEAQNAELSDSVKLVSVSKLGSRESVSEKDRLKAGIMTTNKKVHLFY